jgi:hypothetical protein
MTRNRTRTPMTATIDALKARLRTLLDLQRSLKRRHFRPADLARWHLARAARFKLKGVSAWTA